jgi:hypothetical protein
MPKRKPRRFGGGPRITESNHIFWENEARRIAAEEELSVFSASMYINRILKAKYDFSLDGIEEMNAALEAWRASKRSKDLGAAAPLRIRGNDGYAGSHP